MAAAGAPASPQSPVVSNRIDNGFIDNRAFLYATVDMECIMENRFVLLMKAR